MLENRNYTEFQSSQEKEGKDINLNAYLSTLDPVAKTAFFVAALKYIHSRESNSHNSGLYSDPYMSFFAAPDLIEEAKKLVVNSAWVIDMPAIRHQVILNQLKNCIKKQAIKQVIILGCGLDTTAVCERDLFKSKEITIFEIDQPSILEFKKRMFIKHDSSLLSHVRYIACNYIEQNFIALLSEYGVCFTDPTCFIWEGNVMYLEVNQISDVLNKIKDSFPDVTVIADYYSPERIEEVKKEKPELAIGIENFKSFNAHLKFNCNLQHLITELGFSNIEMITLYDAAKEFNRQYKKIMPDEAQKISEVYTFSSQNSRGVA